MMVMNIGGQPLGRNRIVGTWILLARLTAVEILRNLSAQTKAARLRGWWLSARRAALAHTSVWRRLDSIVPGCVAFSGQKTCVGFSIPLLWARSLHAKILLSTWLSSS